MLQPLSQRPLLTHRQALVPASQQLRHPQTVLHLHPQSMLHLIRKKEVINDDVSPMNINRLFILALLTPINKCI